MSLAHKQLAPSHLRTCESRTPATWGNLGRSIWKMDRVELTRKSLHIASRMPGYPTQESSSAFQPVLGLFYRGQLP